MKPLYLIIISLFITSHLVHAEGKPRIAQVDYSEINDLLEKIILSKPENKDLANRYLEKERKDQENQDQIQKAILRGEKFDPLKMAKEVMGNSKGREDSKEVEQQSEKYLLSVIENKFKGEYDVILKKSYRNNMIYTKIAIEDITDILRQELLKDLPEIKIDNKSQ